MPKVVRSVFDTLRVVLTLVFVVPVAAGCSAGSVPSLQDGVGSTQDNTSTAPNLVPQCGTPNQGCPCSAEGTEVACKGPETTSGSYTTCSDGVRFCTDGTWGACIGKTLYENVDSVTQEYVSPCPAGSNVQWSGLTLQGSTPANSSISVSVQTAATESDLNTAPQNAIAAFDNNAPSPWPAINVNAALATYGQSSNTWLRVTIALGKASQTGASPSVAWQVASQCVPAQ